MKRTLTHDIDEHGAHRIICATPASTAYGERVPYHTPAVLEMDVTYIAFTQYYAGSVPVEQVMVLTPIKKDQ